MLNPRLIPTPLEGLEEREPVKIVEPISPRNRTFSILRQLAIWCLATLWDLMTGRWRTEKHAQRTRIMFERLGFLWIKAGQILSLRRDVFSDAFCDELSRLQFQTAGFPERMAREIIEEELGAAPEHFFDDYEERPFAAASIAQVHRATLRAHDTAVAIKIMRPGAEDIFALDLRFFRLIVGLIRRLNIMSFMRWKEALWELEQVMAEETDYRFEMANLKRLRRHLKKTKAHIPKVFEEYSSQRVLVMEFIDGPLMADYIEVEEKDPQCIARWLAENNIDTTRVAERIFFSFMRQLFEDNLFHGDLHPGNIILLRDSHFAFIDLGTIGSLEQGLWKKYLHMTKTFATGEFDKSVDLLFAMCPELPVIDLAEVKEEMIRALRAWEARTKLTALPYHDKSLTAAVVELYTIMAKYRIMATWGFFKSERTWATLDASLHYLIPKVDYPKLIDRYYLKRRRRMIRKYLTPDVLIDAALSIPETVSEYALFIDPAIRRASFMFQSRIGKMAAFFATIFKSISKVFFIAGTFLLASYLYKVHNFFEADAYEILHIYADRLPFEQPVSWLISIGLTYYLFILFWRLGRKLAEKEVRISNATRAA